MTDHDHYLRGIQAAIDYLEEKGGRHSVSCYEISAVLLKYLKTDQLFPPTVAEEQKGETQ